MLKKSLEVLEFIGMPAKMAATIVSVFIGFSLCLAVLPPFLFVKNLSAKVENMEINVVQKVDSIIGMVSNLDNTQKILIEWTIDSSKTSEYTTSQLVEILKAIAKEERVKIIISEKEKAIEQYQIDHLPHYQPPQLPTRKFSIGIKPDKK
jgi:hypothetical protein